MKKLLLLCLVLLGGFSTATAEGTKTTVYCAVSTTYTVKIQVKTSNGNEPIYEMEKTKYTYNGIPIYKCVYTDEYNGVDYMDFHLYDGDQWKEKKRPYSSWTTVGTYNGKLFRYSENDWVAYNTDGIKGSWDSWSAKSEFENGQLTIDINSVGNEEFKIEVGGTLYGAQTSGATMFWNNCTNWTLDGSNNCVLQASATGTYTFTLAENKKVSVTFPAYTPNEVYLYNNLSLAAGPYAYVLKGEYWSSANGAGSKNQPKGVTMTQVGTSNVWKAEYPGGAKSNYIAFTEFLMDDYENFNGGKAVYRGDFPTTSSVFVPNTSTSESKNGTTYFEEGAWHPFPTYTRTVTKDNFGTICLPFAATVEGATVFKIVSKIIEGGNFAGVNLESVDALEAGKAYIFKATGTTLTATMSGNYSDATPGYGMMGNLSSPVTVPAGNYVIKGNQICPVGEEVTCGQYKGYITLVDINPATSKGANFIGLDGYSEETDGIAELKTMGNVENGNIYNLAGQKVGANYKGIIVVNGKKVVRK